MEHDEIQEDLEKLYKETIDGGDTLVRFTPLELEQLNNLLDIGMRGRKSHFMKNARKEKRKLNKWERHLLKADRNLWQKIRDAEDIAMGERRNSLRSEA